jgi:ABC-type branched-subunit amino acid transport system substrate-binding protein
MARLKIVPLLAVLVATLALSACDKRQQFSSIFGSRQAGQAGAPSLPAPTAPETGPGMALPPGDPALQSPNGQQLGLLPGDQSAAPPALPRIEPGVPRVAILLPLTGQSAPIGTALLNAAQLALFHFADRKFELLPHDTRGTAEGAADAARFAIADGASLILGPLFNFEVEAVAPAARASGVKVIGFTSDKRVASDGIYVMGFLPDEQVERVARYAYSRGVRRFAMLGPDDTYGQTIRDALLNVVMQLPGAEVTRIETYDPNAHDFAPVVRRLADYDARRAALLAQKQQLAGREDEVSKAALRRLETQQTAGDVPFDALLIADGGKRLEAIAALLPYYAIAPKRTRMLGTGLWDTPGIGKEPALLGAWYAAPSPAARATFEKQYAEIYGGPPSRLATLAYDATALAALFAPAQGMVDEAAITAPQGFTGRDGVFRFLTDGVAERGLTVRQVNAHASTEISAAPTTFTPLTN